MQSSDGNGSDVERRLSVRSSTTTRTDITDDEYDPASYAIADGFRPSAIPDSTSNHGASSSISSANVTAPTAPTSFAQSTSAASSAQPQILNRPSSVAKPPRAIDHLALRHDGPFVHTNVSRLSRASSGAGSVDSPIIRSVSPYQGPSGPSHPYQMYPQRTMSVATSATAPVSERSYQGPQRPTHPYGLYTQATEGSDSSDVTVGFGRPDNYQRRIGPDGEDAADLIGPLGHTEELPPYTRYPDVAYIAKNNEVAAHVADPIDGPSTLRTTPAIPGAGGLGLATRNPEYESRDDLPLPPAQSRLSTRSVTSDVVSQHEINTAAEAYTEKQKSPRWQTRAKKRMWGIVPYWAVCLVAVALLIMGIVLGAVIGTLLAKGDGNNKKKPDEDAFPATGTTTTTTTDIIPLATPPADLPPLVEGTFSLPPLIESQAPTTCFNDTSQAQAWTCNVPFEIYSMTLANLQDASPVADYVLQLFLSNNSSPSDLYTWGTQPPIIEDPIQMRLVKDTAELELGPAWFGHFVYNKTVIIAEDRFPNVGSANKRRGFVLDDPTSGFRRAGVIGAQVGDRPWICEWPGTMLEIFIYPYQINSLSRNRGFTAETSSTSPIPSSSVAPPPDNRAFTETVSVGPPPAPTPRPPKIAAPPYPNIIKIEESRLSDDDSRAAVCTQVEICADGISSKPVYGADGQPIRVNIIENQRQVAYRFEEPTAQPIDAPTGVLPRQEDGKYAHLSECGCMWWFR